MNPRKSLPIAAALAALLLLANFAAAQIRPADAVVRLRSHGGSGTVIATGDGWTIILSCAHMFEKGDRNRPVTVDVPYPVPGNPKRVGVTVLAVGRTDDVDLSLLKLHTGPLPYVAPVAPKGTRPTSCLSVGYDSLKTPPQCRPAKIVGASGNDWLTDSRPWHGRSGGALIDRRTGKLVGVVSAYTGPSNHAEYQPGCNGVYVALPTIHKFLARAGVKLQGLDQGDEDPFDGDLRREEDFGPRQGPSPGFGCPGGSCPLGPPRGFGCPGGLCPLGPPRGFGCPGGNCPRCPSNIEIVRPVWKESYP